MKILNEHFINVNENIKFEALSQLREIQSNLIGISFLPVIAIMKPDNPLKKEVLAFQDDLDELAIRIQEFISDAKNDVEFEPDMDGAEVDPEEEEVEDEEIEDEEEPEEEEEDDKDKKKSVKKEDKKKEDKKKEDKKKKVEDSSEPKV